MRSYQDFIDTYGTMEEKILFYSGEGQELAKSRQEAEVWDRISSEARYEIMCGCETIDNFLTDTDLDYWRKAGEMAAKMDLGFYDWIDDLDEDDEDDRLIMEDLGLL